jgi:hypothetical protein
MVDVENNDLESLLKWARFVDDSKILKSDDRKKLKAYLEKLLQGLNQRYISRTAQAFPSNFELSRLSLVVTALAKKLGIKKSGFGDLFSAMKRIENRWNKMLLIAFADDLRNRLLRLPLSPLSVVYQASKTNANHKGTLDEITKFLSSKNDSDTANIPWGKWSDVVQSLKFPTSTLLSAAELNLLRAESSKSTTANKQTLAYLVFMNLKRQQLEWNNKYREQTKASMQWILNLQRPDDYQKLTQVFWGDALSPGEMRKAMAKLANRERRNRSYQKHHVG